LSPRKLMREIISSATWMIRGVILTGIFNWKYREIIGMFNLPPPLVTYNCLPLTNETKFI
jgi:hypothetical protein